LERIKQTTSRWPTWTRSSAESSCSTKTRIANHYRDSLRIKTPNVEQRLQNLSGGNQQKVVLAKSLNTDPTVLIVDEPTRGIDVGAKYEIHSILNDMAARGASVIVISPEMPELLGVCDRIYVMYEGRIKGVFNREDATQEAIMALALSVDTGGGS
jgi:putative multiple sugar transport system ATP-binding protein